MVKVVAYYRTSSKAGVGDDKDSKDRQQEAVKKYADKNDMKIVAEFYDAAVSGTDNVLDRPKFCEMLTFMKSNGIEVVLVETANRFARDLIVQLTGHDFLKSNDISLVPVDAPDHFTDETPTAILIRQVLGAVAEFQKRNLVEVMKKGREKKRRETGRCEGRIRAPQEAIDLAKELRDQGLSLRAISAELKSRGFTVVRKNPDKSPPKAYPAASIKYMLENIKNEQPEENTK